MKNSLITHRRSVALHSSQSRFARTLSQLASILILLVLAQATSLVFGQDLAARLPRLEANTPTEHRPTDAERNVFQIEVGVAEYLRISITQRDLPLDVGLLAPDGRVLVRIDNANGKLERMVFSVLVDQVGSYHLFLDNPKRPEYKTFTINIEEKRAATPEDKQRVATERMFLEAERFRVEGSTESTVKAIRTCESILSLRPQVTPRDEAQALTTLGQLNAAIDQKDKALLYFTQALSVWKRLGDVSQTASTLSDMGVVYNRQNQRLKALDTFQESLAIYRALGNRSGEAYVLQSLGHTYATFGDTRKALDQYNRALKIWEESGNKEGRAFTYAAMGRLFEWPLDSTKVLNYYSEAFRLWEAEDSDFGEEYLAQKLAPFFSPSSKAASTAVLESAIPTRRQSDTARTSNRSSGSKTGSRGNRRPASQAPAVSAGADFAGGRSVHKTLDAATEEVLWKQLDSFNDPAGFSAYLTQFPSGRFTDAAKARLKDRKVSTFKESTDSQSVFAPVPNFDGLRWAYKEKTDGLAQSKVRIERKPLLEAPDPIVESKEFDVLVWLTDGSGVTTPDAKVTPDNPKAPNQLALQLPDENGWNVEVLLVAQGFVVVDGTRANLFLPKTGDSTPARFKLRPTAFRGPQQKSTISATFWYKNSFLGRVEREVTIVRADSLHAETVPQPTIAMRGVAPSPPNASPKTVPRATGEQSTIVLEPAKRIPDLTIITFKAPHSEERLVQVESRYLPQTVAQVYSQKDLSDWLIVQYRELTKKSTLLAKLNGADDARDRAEASAQAKEFMRTFSGDLYLRFCPASVKTALWDLSSRLGENFNTIQIYSDDFDLPWELMRPVNTNGEERGLLGIEFEIGRWHLKTDYSGSPLPLQQVSINKLIVIAPQYPGKPMEGQERELEALKSMRGYEPWPGKITELRKKFQDLPLAIIYFAGHGSMSATEGNLYQYSIQLEDGPLDVMTWRGMITSTMRNRPLFFFNACSVGQTQNIANFVDGWAPAVLDAGASGYVGSLWPVSQTGAADFGVTFYSQFDQRLKDGPASVAKTLMETRRKFLENGDPTFLAYVYFGDADLELVREPK